MLRCVLEEVKAKVTEFAASKEAAGLYSAKPPTLRAISPLAEGSDRMFAEGAIDLGYELVCPFPFHQEEFEKDFKPPQSLEPNSLERFRGLLDRARAQGSSGLTTFELDGDRSNEGQAYGAGGRVVLNQSDLLIAVWDGGQSAGAGGTVDTLKQAVNYHVPVLWIYPAAPHSWQLLHKADDFKCLDQDDRCVPHGPHPTDPAEVRKLIGEAVRRIVREEIALPEESSTDPRRPATTKANAAKYFDERKPWINFAFAWKLFRNAVGSWTYQHPVLRVRDFEGQIEGEWPTRINDDLAADSTDAGATPAQSAHPPSDVEDWVNRRLRPHYAWPDKRGDLYADAYRSTYILTYLLSATAVLVALLPMAMGWKDTGELVCVAIEFVFLTTILLLLWAARKWNWHERWIEYRLLAELVRQLRILIPLGGGRPFPRVPPYLEGYGSLTQTWMYWHMRAIARSTGIPGKKVTSQYVRDCLDYVASLVDGQLGFHQNNETRSENIAHRLHVTAIILFGLTIVSIAIHLMLELSGHVPSMHGLHDVLPDGIHPILVRWLVFFSATLPAFGAALAGISNQGEFARLAKRSAAMADSFERFSAQIAALRSGQSPYQGAPKLTQVAPLAGKIAEVMVDEVSDWRVVFTDRPNEVV